MVCLSLSFQCVKTGMLAVGLLKTYPTRFSLALMQVSVGGPAAFAEHVTLSLVDLPRPTHITGLVPSRGSFHGFCDFMRMKTKNLVVRLKPASQAATGAACVKKGTFVAKLESV